MGEWGNRGNWGDRENFYFFQFSEPGPEIRPEPGPVPGLEPGLEPGPEPGPVPGLEPGLALRCWVVLKGPYPWYGTIRYYGFIWAQRIGRKIRGGPHGSQWAPGGSVRSLRGPIGPHSPTRSSSAVDTRSRILIFW